MRRFLRSEGVGFAVDLHRHSKENTMQDTQDGSIICLQIPYKME